MKTVILIPTYNEKENLSLLVKRIFQQGLENLEIIIIDDNSPDGTGKIADQLVSQYPNKVQVIHRARKEGLGQAYIDGFKKVLGEKADFIITMDADLSHEPKYLSSFLNQDKNLDIVIGSRYIKGGKMLISSFPRRALSCLANIFTRFILNLKIRDCTAGYKRYSRQFIQSLDLDNFFSQGYAFQVETIYRAKSGGFLMTEIPIIFVERNLGRSKISPKEIFRSIRSILKLALFSKK